MREGAKTAVAGTLTDNEIEIIATPTDSIDWSGLIEDSCWRESTFEEFSGRNVINEKGFRDQLILEAFLASTKTATSDHVVFVAQDKRLRETLGARCKEEGIDPMIVEEFGVLGKIRIDLEEPVGSICELGD